MTNNISKINSANSCADNMLTRINECFQDSIKELPKIKSAVVSAVNDDGTVNVYFPPNNTKVFTRISNQSAFTLQVGDSVELMLKNGNFDNCWILAKHGINYTNVDYKNIIEENSQISQEIDSLKQQISNTNQQISNIKVQIEEIKQTLKTLTTQ